MRSAAGRPLGRVHVEISTFSATVRSGKMPLSSGAQPMPSWAISWVGRPWISWPRKVTRPARGSEIAHDGAQRGRLARAVAADQADDLALADLERDAAQDVAGLDVDVDALDREHQAGSGSRPITVSTTWRFSLIAAGAASASTLPWCRAMIRSE